MKKFWLFCSLCCVCFSGFGQGTTPPPPLPPGSLTGEEILSHIYSMDMNYNDIVQHAEIYLNSFPNDESFAKQFGRWSGFWNSRVDASGDFNTTYQNMMNVLDNYPICGGDAADWSQTGPIINTQNLEVIVTVAAPSGQSNIIYAGSNTGGLWKTINGGDSWNNVTDILGFPGLGVNDIIIHPNNPDILYIATGYNYSFVPQNYGAGVFISTNGGDTWEETDLTWDPLTSTEARERLAINKLTFHPTDPSIIFALSHFEVYKMQMLTNSNGAISGWNKTTITPLNELSKYIDIEFVETATNVFDTYISTLGTYINGAGHSGSLFRSTNYGDNNAWTKIPIKSPPTSGPGAVAHPHNDRINTCVIEAAKDDATDKDKLYVYYLYTDLTNSNPSTGYYTYISPLFEYDHDATVGDGWSLLRSDFNDIHQPEPQYTNFEVNPQNADVMYFPNRKLGKTRDKGQIINNISNGTYVNSAIHDDNRDIIIVDIDPNGANNQDILIVGNDGGVSKGEYYASSHPLLYLYGWININQGSYSTPISDRLIASQCTDISISNNISGTEKVIVAGAIDNANYIKNNSNFAWSNIGNVDGGQTAINETYGLAFTRKNDVLEIFDINTLNSEHQFTPNFGGSEYDDFAGIEIDKNDPDLFYVAKNRYFKQYQLNNNFQASLTNIDVDFDVLLDQYFEPHTSVSCFEINPAYPNKMLLAFTAGTQYGGQWNPRFFKSDDYGEHWAAIGNTPTNPTSPFLVTVDGNILNPIETNYITDICYSTDNPSHVWASISRWANDADVSGTPVINSRVIFSDDGGDTWNDYSTGLTIAPINALTYQEGSNGVLFAATDVGVYRYNPDIGEWECFNQGFPVSLVNDLEISNCEQKIYASAYGRGIWESSIPPATGRKTISNNTIWDTDRNVMTTTVVETGKTLTIENCTVNIGRGMSIIVEPGAKLIIHNATLTNTCGEMWDGIIVQGDATASQSNSAQGTLITRVNSQIEYAKNAIRVWDPIDGGGISKTGGIINCTQTTFLNNNRDVEFMKYDLGVRNRSTFVRCTFKLDNDYRSTIYDLDDRVTMWHVNGVRFAGCAFEMNTHFAGSHKRRGIYSIDAGYDVGASCDVSVQRPNPCPEGQITRSEFKNFYHGIEATATNNHTIRVNKTDFNANVFGVTIRDMDNIQVTECDFQVGYQFGPGIGTTSNFGVAIFSGTGYEVQENTFTGTGTYGVPNSAGVHVLNTGAAQNRIYKNTFTGLQIANSAAGVNNSLNYQSGLQYLCNTQSNNNFDISVYDGPGIQEFQGTPASTPSGDNTSDGNVFSNNGSPANMPSDYSVEYGVAHGITRFYTTGEKANDVTGNSQVDQVTDNTISDGCPSILEELDEVTIIAGRVGQINDYTTHEAAYNNSVYLYDNLIDGGNPQGLSNNIQYNWSNDAWQMRTELLAESPNLSEEALLDVAFTGTLPDALLMEVLLANPRSVRSPEFHEILINEIPNPLPQYMVDMLPFAAETPSVRVNLEKQIVHYGYKKSQAAKLLVHYALRDSIIELDTVKYWLEKDITPKGRFALAEHYLSRGQYTLAQNILNDVETEFERYFEYQNTAYQAYQQLMTLKVNILQNGRTWLDVTESEKGQLQTIAYNSNDDAAFQARNILCFFFDECVEEPINLGGTANPARIIQVENPMLQLTESLTNLTVYPNPATDYVTFDYELPEYIENATIVITTIKGDVVQQFDLTKNKNQILWDTRQVENGIYFYALKQSKNTLASGKVSILK